MRIVTEQNIAKVNFFLAVLVISLITLGVGIYFVVTKYELSSRELSRVETMLIERQKQTLQADVEKLQLRIEALSRSLQENQVAQTENADQEEQVVDDSKEAMLQQMVIDELGWADDLCADTFFIYKLHDMAGGDNFASMLFSPARPDLVGQQLSTDFPDAKGVDFRKVFMKDIRDRGESFVTYWYTKSPEEGTEEDRIGRKMAYFRLDPEWSWIVAKSVYLDSIDLFIEQRSEALKRAILLDLAVLAVLFLGSVVLAFFLAYSFSLGIQALFSGKDMQHM